MYTSDITAQMSAPTMEPNKSPEECSERKIVDPPASTSGRSENAPIATGVSPPMSPSAFSPTSPVTSSPETRPSKFQIPLPFQARSITRAATTDSIFRSRSKSPRKSPPTTITTKPVTSRSPTPHDALARTGSEPAVSPTSPTNPASPSRPMTLKRTRKTSGTTSHCGRHSNDWLFGGISVRETVKGIWKDNNDSNER